MLSYIFLDKSLRLSQWIGMAVLVAGLVVVGAASLMVPSSQTQASNPVLGNLLVVAAQLVVAVQMVVEQKYLDKYHLPAMLVVGWEGVFGTHCGCPFVGK